MSVSTDQLGENETTGVTFVPPLNAKMMVKAPILTQRTDLGTQSLGVVRSLPMNFSWRDPDSIEEALGWKPRGQVLATPVNQYHCGSCWAISSATMLADRINIFQDKPGEPERMSATYLMQCMDKTAKCNGGFPSDAGLFFETTGTIAEQADPYSWCTENPACVKGLGTTPLSQLLPECPTTKSNKRWKARKNTTQALVTADSIKTEILNHGPVVAVYRVFGDFVQGAKPRGDGWAATGGIYCRVPGKELYNYPAMMCATGPTPPGSTPSNCYMGNHAVVIVGWGVQDVPDFLHGTSETVSVPYWVVRNSWGTHWNDEGYFRVAQSDLRTGLNVDLALDRPLRISGQLFGGATTWLPEVTWSTRKGARHQQGQALRGLFMSTPPGGGFPTWMWFILAGVCFSVLVLLANLSGRQSNNASHSVHSRG